ncbi:MAG: DUF6036 family nucleotidyltransferase [Kiritimatiellae bacterium]|nr:DUF6036 family nucleotidyltransferase [Kiritimatiellia bacterium]
MEKYLNRSTLDLAMRSLAIRLDENGADGVQIVVCGGSALILTGMVPRTTKDVDIVALIRAGVLISPAPLPPSLCQAAQEVAEDLALAPNWLNNGPSSGEGGLFQMGLPDGFIDRLTSESYNDLLIVHFIGRFDQIHFKLYASVDRGGYHIEDLRSLNPTPDELEDASRWCMTHDVSDGFSMVLKRMLKELGYENVADRL